ncbi:CPBP family intramembrane glutamic endopeptidase [Yoonia sp. BS5-3]|uniref:Lysostaphin resistance A-like protein n=1 Tax=Yoonia phaeophyticola TaxID=3137369 RepID=A0ABZ2V2Q4_9RHOB
MPSLRLALRMMLVYFAVIALATTYRFVLNDPPGDTMAMLRGLLPVQLFMAAFLVFVVTRFAGWAIVGFGPLQWPVLLWLCPSVFLMVMMLWGLDLAQIYAQVGPGLWLLVLVPFLIGFSEELMFRGLLLRGVMTRLPAGQAMLLSAVCFALLHGFNGIGLQAVWPTIQNMALAFCVGFFLAPLALKLGNLWPVIIWHAIWDLLVFSSQISGLVHPGTLFAILIQAVLCIWLWADMARQDNAVRNVA